MNEVTALAEPKDRLRAKHPGNGLTALSTTAIREACNDLAATLTRVGGSPEGLIESDAVERLEEVGPNEVAREKPPYWLFQLLACFKNPFILVLVVLAIIQYVTNPDDLRPVIIVSVMVAISVGLQFLAGVPLGFGGGKAQSAGAHHCPCRKYHPVGVRGRIG